MEIWMKFRRYYKGIDIEKSCYASTTILEPFHHNNPTSGMGKNSSHLSFAYRKTPAGISINKQHHPALCI